MPLVLSRARRGLLPFIATLAALCCLLAPASRADAAPGQETIFDAPRDLLGSPSIAVRARTLFELKRLGADTVRILVPWRYLVPRPGRARRPAGFSAADPRDYPQWRWGALDGIVGATRALRMNILLTPSSPIPDWASASGRSRIASPIPREFRDFTTALGRRYSGNFRPEPCRPGVPVVGGESCPPPLPRVRSWSFWNEPNSDLFLRPQKRRGRPYSPRLYRRLFLAGQSGLRRAGHGRDRFLLGETAPSGGFESVDPLPFLRGVLCLRASLQRRRGCDPIRATGWSHHPYAPGIAPFRRSPNPNLINFVNLGRMHRILRAAARTGATAERLPVFVTEFGIQSVPDRRFGVSLRRQAEFLAIGEYLAFRDPLVRSWAQYQLRDDPPNQEFSFTTGLRLAGGRAKPSLRAFPLTLLVRRLRARRALVWGHVRPGAGRARVTVRVDSRRGRPHRLRTLRASRRGYFSFRIRIPRGRGLRWQATARLRNGRRITGTYVRSYSF